MRACYACRAGCTRRWCWRRVSGFAFTFQICQGHVGASDANGTGEHAGTLWLHTLLHRGAVQCLCSRCCCCCFPLSVAGGMFEDALAVLEAGSSSRRLRDPLGVKEQQVGGWLVERRED